MDYQDSHINSYISGGNNENLEDDSNYYHLGYSIENLLNEDDKKYGGGYKEKYARFESLVVPVGLIFENVIHQEREQQIFKCQSENSSTLINDTKFNELLEMIFNTDSKKTDIPRKNSIKNKADNKNKTHKTHKSRKSNK